MKIITYLFLLVISIHTALAQDVISPKYIIFNVSNDLIDKTDSYYTSGLSLTINHPILRKNPFNKLIPALPGAVDKIYGLNILQDIYTPADVDTNVYLANDRPYVGNMMLYMQKTSFLTFGKMSLTSGLGLGFIGNIALGEQAQNGFHNLIHNNVYNGWYNQLDNKLLLNYNIAFQKGLHVDKNNQFIATVDAEAGNLRDNIGFGYLWRVGKLAPCFQSYVYKKGDQKFYFSVFMDVKFKFIMYDATLSQSHSNLNSYSYTINHFVFHSRAGLSLMYERFTILFIQNFLSPEFSTGFSHRYASLELNFRF